MELKKRKGKVAISLYVLKSMEIEHLSALFGNFFPLTIESNPVNEMLTYWGTSMFFDEIEEGEKIPTYEAHIEQSIQFGTLSIEFIKISDASG